MTHPRSSPQGVRFASGVQEIQPVHSIHQMVMPPGQEVKSSEDLTPEAKEEIRNLAMTLQKSKLQESRLSNYAFEPVSLPPSRVCQECPWHILDEQLYFLRQILASLYCRQVPPSVH